MSLQALLLTRDAQVRKAVADAFKAASIRTQSAVSVDDTLRLLSEAKFEAVVIDCGNVPDGIRALEELRKGKINKSVIAFALLNDRAAVKGAYEAGANFVLQHPISADAVTRSLRAAHGLILRERRRYHRHRLKGTAYLVLGDDQELQAEIINVSEGGMSALVRYMTKKPTGAVRVRFSLPDSEVAVEGKGEISWCRDDGRMGIRFTQLRNASRTELDRWMLLEMERSPIYVHAANAMRTLSAKS